MRDVQAGNAAMGIGPQALELPRRVSDWCQSSWKRAFDLVCVIPLLIVLSPLIVVIAACVLFSSGRPVLFRQNRYGRGGTVFKCLKFRTMKANNIGPGVTQAGDLRVTRIGHVLRKWKLDELPQLLNVLCGDMSFVGPRPDLPEFIAELDNRARSEFSLLTPGITGWATLSFRHEEELLANIHPENLRYYYTHEVLPRKVALDLDYASRASFLSDLKILFRTVAIIFE